MAYSFIRGANGAFSTLATDIRGQLREGQA